MNNDEWRGGCLCGAVRYAAEADPDWVAHCHCESCRRHSGGAMTTFAGFDATHFRWLAKTGVYNSSAGVTRRFCPNCGTPLSYESERWPDEVHILVGTLDDPARAVPSAHVHVAEQVPWLHVADGLPRYAGTSDGAEPVAAAGD